MQVWVFPSATSENIFRVQLPKNDFQMQLPKKISATTKTFSECDFKQNPSATSKLFSECNYKKCFPSKAGAT
jgi:hypothetical protein